MPVERDKSSLPSLNDAVAFLTLATLLLIGFGTVFYSNLTPPPPWPIPDPVYLAILLVCGVGTVIMLGFFPIRLWRERDKGTRERVIAHVAEQLGVPLEQVAERISHLDGTTIDSLDVVEIIMELEEDFDDDDPDSAGSLARLIQPPDTDGRRALLERPEGDAE